ncbi:hypothetical protein ACWA1C_12780 [Flectobacillus roseus]
MNKFLKMAMVFLSFLAGVSIYAYTGNPIVSGLSMMSTSAGLQMLTGQYLEFPTGAFTVPLVGLKRKTQNPQLGGSKRLYVILTEDLLNEFVDYNLILSTGQFAGAIPLAPGKMAVEIEAWYDTLKWDGEMKTGGGFTQGVEFDVLGFDKDIAKAMALLYETPVNLIVQGNDNSLYYFGDKYIPFMFDAKITNPPKGTERKRVTFTAKNDGYSHPIVPLANTVTFAVQALS